MTNTIELLERQIVELDKKRQELLILKQIEINKDWRNTADSLIMHTMNDRERIEIECNAPSWREAKEELNENQNAELLFLDIYEQDESISACTVLTLAQTKALRNYLNEKIEYLEG